MNYTDFTGVMAQHTDEDLIFIAYFSEEDYQPLAVAAAKEEIKKRNISASDIELVRKRVLKWQEYAEKEQEQEEKDRKRTLKIQLVVWLVFIVIGGILYLIEGETSLFVVFALIIPFYIYMWWK